MAPKEPYKVHSLNKHIENTKKGLSAEAQFNRRPGNRATSIKKESSDPNNIFANNDGDDDDESGSGSDSDSSSDEPADFISKLTSTTKPASATPRRRSKDDEIADSDAERNASKKSTVVKNAAPAKSKARSSSDSSSEDESHDEKTKAKANGTTPAKASESTSNSSESGSDSDSDEEDDKSPKLSTKKQEDSASTSDSSSDSESEDEEQNVKLAAKPAAKPVAPKSDSSSDEEEDSDDEMVDESMHIEDRQGQLALPNFIAPDFVLRKGDDGTNGRDVAEICNKANLEGKQFWYFTVPSNVPISVVQNLEIPMNQSQSTDKLFSHNGEDYGVSFESIAPKGNIQIMIPSDRPQYQPVSKQIDQVMQVKKITQLGSTHSVAPVPKPAPRAQPAGLKARYQPIGVNEPMGSIGDDEDVEMGDAPVLSTKAAKKEKKRKSKETSDKKQKKGQSIPEPPSSRTTEAPTSESRKNKRKLAASEDDAVAVAEQLQEEAKLAASKSKKQKTARAGSPDLGSEPTSTVAKKYTPVLPPAIPTVGTPTPKSASTPVTSSKKQKKVKEASVPAPRQSVVPIPSIPHSSPPRSSPARAPASQPPASPSQGKEKRARKRKDKDGKKTPSGKKETPVVPPVPLSSSE
ncbi:SRP40-suppressor of mutant AC40 of RNA polymerase I and III [Fusarium subglutinans]|uniref:SRP40-suppressor of mutant AC40 of RNA polymerase I and III n=1 Tax=Gibberella subglutinans TaxID=42677 RepID=A0A8H5V015_GIBSU|nr:SRP40-suppressor of mutant AC40 of RNA polymerase I and III [Fusarium subglutinans]KAF5605566.1 SRP40-suppressor of mutant AC40 of RNA polymerase I and III [Fusarium subglutinans]